MNESSRVGPRERDDEARITGAGQFSAVYVDETSQTQHRYLALGALVVPMGALSDLETALRVARYPELPPEGEMKWGKVSAAKLPAYKRMVDAFFRFPAQGHRTEFHSLHVDTHRLRDRAFNGGSREVGFNKEVYQIVRKIGMLHPSRLFHVYLDDRSTASTTEHLRYMLNCDVRKRAPDRDWPFRRVHFRDSGDCLGIQLVDVLLGSVAFRLNGHRDKPGASPSKCELSDYVKAKVPYRDALIGTNREGRFTIWQRQLR